MTRKISGVIQARARSSNARLYWRTSSWQIHVSMNVRIIRIVLLAFAYIQKQKVQSHGLHYYTNVFDFSTSLTNFWCVRREKFQYYIVRTVAVIFIKFTMFRAFYIPGSSGLVRLNFGPNVVNMRIYLRTIQSM